MSDFELKGFDRVENESNESGIGVDSSCEVGVDASNSLKDSYDGKSLLDLSDLGYLYTSESDFMLRGSNLSVRCHDIKDVDVVDFDSEMMDAIDSAMKPSDVAKIVSHRRLFEEMKSNDIKVRFLAHLEANYGIVSYALRGSGLTRKQFNKLMKMDESFRLEVDSMKDLRLDLAELTLCECMERGNVKVMRVI